LFSPTSWRTTVATNDLVKLPTRNLVPARIGLFLSTAARPPVRVTVAFPFRARTTAPGTPAATS
jgi:hypothetical protein